MNYCDRLPYQQPSFLQEKEQRNGEANNFNLKSCPAHWVHLIENEKIAAWFIQNIDREASEKLIPIPIGIANKHWAHGNTELFNRLIPISLAKTSKSIFCYLNYTERPSRTECTEHFHKMGLNVSKGKSFVDYLSDLSESIFVVSPPGNGLDCHRTWEALLMGCYPIVLSSTLDPIYKDLPVVVVEDWNEVTPLLLEKIHEKWSSRSWDRTKLYADYWFDQIKKIQIKLRDP